MRTLFMALLVLAGLLLLANSTPERGTCYTDSECAAMFGGDGGPETLTED